jgi:alpha-N-arabinofuranosidase
MTRPIAPDVLDEHFYMSAEKSFSDADHYDKVDRSGPKIFVGEWATREGSPTPNFGAALGDAAWMTGMERNSDLIVMAAYAPLLVRVDPGGMQWETDLIGYDAMHSYGSPSYWAQVMFAKYVGSETPASKLEGAGVDATNPKFFYSITRDAAKKRLYLKLVNASSTPLPVNIDIAGDSLAETGKLITLKANSTQASNTLEKPTQIVPEEGALPGVSNHLHHTVPGYAIQVIQLDEK